MRGETLVLLLLVFSVRASFLYPPSSSEGRTPTANIESVPEEGNEATVEEVGEKEVSQAENGGEVEDDASLPPTQSSSPSSPRQKPTKLREERIEQMRSNYRKRSEEERMRNAAAFREYNNQWMRVKPKLFLPPRDFYVPPPPPVLPPICPPCDCGSFPSDDMLPGARSLMDPQDIEDLDVTVPLEEEDEEDEPIPYPNMQRYMKPIDSGNKRRKRSAEDYWYSGLGPNEALTSINSGYRARNLFRPRALSYVRPLHFGGIHTGESKFAKGRRFSYDADFNLPEDSHAFSRKPYYGYYR